MATDLIFRAGRTMLNLRKVAVIFASMLSSFSMAHAANNEASPVVSNRVSSERVVADPTYTQWFDRRLAVVESGLSDQKSGSDSLSLQLSLIGIGFGALITLTVVFFALRTERTAAAAAAAAANDAISASKNEIERLLREAQLVKVEADQVLLSMRQGQGEAELHVGKIKAALMLAERYSTSSDEKNGMSKEEGKVISAGAEALDQRNPSSWSHEDFVILIADAQKNKNYSRVDELVGMMRVLLKSDVSAAYAKNIMGNNLISQKKYDEASIIYSDAVNNYLRSDNRDVARIGFASARNLALTYIHKKDYASAKSWIDQMIALAGEVNDPRSNKTLSNFYYNKAQAEFHLGDCEQAVSAIELMLDLWCDDDEINERIVTNSISISGLMRTNNAEKSVEIFTTLIEKVSSDKMISDKYMKKLLNILQANELAASGGKG